MGLDTVELVMSFEEDFGVEIPNDIADKLVTPSDVRDYVIAEYKRRGLSADPDQIFERIRDLVAEIGNLDRSKIALDSSFVEDLGLD